MGGKNDPLYARFVELCAQAFNILRRHGPSLINMFTLMVPAGMPELKSSEDIHYLREMLYRDDTEEAAASTFHEEIEKGLKNWFKTVDNAFHILKHA